MISSNNCSDCELLNDFLPNPRPSSAWVPPYNHPWLSVGVEVEAANEAEEDVVEDPLPDRS